MVQEKLPKDIDIIPANLIDTLRIHEINKECLPIYYFASEFMLYIMSNKHILLKATFKKTKIVGYLLAQWNSDTNLHIMSIGVIPEYRRKNIGKFMIDTLIETGKQRKPYIKNVTLYIQVCNTGAIQFYIENMFKKKKLIEHYYNENDNAFLMNRKI